MSVNFRIFDAISYDRSFLKCKTLIVFIAKLQTKVPVIFLKLHLTSMFSRLLLLFSVNLLNKNNELVTILQLLL